jgi:hypothetical protein
MGPQLFKPCTWTAAASLNTETGPSLASPPIGDSIILLLTALGSEDNVPLVELFSSCNDCLCNNQQHAEACQMCTSLCDTNYYYYSA